MIKSVCIQSRWWDEVGEVLRGRPLRHFNATPTKWEASGKQQQVESSSSPAEKPTDASVGEQPSDWPVLEVGKISSRIKSHGEKRQ